MSNNLFSKEQYDYLYSDVGFVEFLNEYFSIYDVTNQKLKIDLRDVDGIENIYMYIRIVCANMDSFMKSVHNLSQNVSYSFEKGSRVYQGEIKGRLLINDYAKELAKHEIPRKYKCSIKQKTYNTIENIYILFILHKVSDLLESFLKVINEIPFKDKEKSKELIAIGNYLKTIREYINKPFFVQCRKEVRRIQTYYKGKFPPEYLELVGKRIRTGKIRNCRTYEEVLNWIEKFQRNSIYFIDDSTLETLKYSESFSQKLFELWVLYKIKETFVDDYNCTLIESNNIMHNKEGYIFKLETITGGTLEIYFQKGIPLYWNEDYPPKWRYLQEDKEKYLSGIPDISIKYSTIRQSLIMIDVKNKNRIPGKNSDEIYKMIGYFNNFKDAFRYIYSEDVKKQAALVFRNDLDKFEENLISDEGYRIKNLSVSPTESEDLNKNQFKILCKYILDMQGMDGTTSGVMGSYAKNSKEILQQAIEGNEDEDVVAYRLSKDNHLVIESLFKTSEMKDALDKALIEMEQNYFPHIWSKMSEKTKTILGMAECLFKGVTPCETADYAPICLEYCRAFEVQINEQILQPFRDGYTTNEMNQLVRRNKSYEKMQSAREMTLGECMFFLQKLNHPKYPMTELREFMQDRIHNYSDVLDYGVDIMKKINESIRRKSAHTTIMTYQELIEARQIILGIGNRNLFYMLLDGR